MTEPEELRELLELAAKACKKTAYWSDSLEDWQKDLTNPTIDGKEWTPHLPGLDSQELAAELGINTLFGSSNVGCSCGAAWLWETFSDHQSKTHAQAIAALKVAAAIGRGLK